jgi:hypothetical protein
MGETVNAGWGWSWVGIVARYANGDTRWLTTPRILM